jgi:hypothetical protein
MVELMEPGLSTYLAEPDGGVRNWQGKTEERDAVYANRREISGPRGEHLRSQRG